MKLKELLSNQKEKLDTFYEKMQTTTTEVENFYLEVKQIKEQLTELVSINKELTECIYALIKEQIGD